jgi:hypothetical protein
MNDRGEGSNVKGGGGIISVCIDLKTKSKEI